MSNNENEFSLEEKKEYEKQPSSKYANCASILCGLIIRNRLTKVAKNRLQLIWENINNPRELELIASGGHPGYTVEDKPGWAHGGLRDVETYTDYLRNVIIPAVD